MRVLLDENLDHRLRRNLGGHEVFTVSFKGWAGLKNGELLRAAEAEGIEVLLTGDQSMVHEQNLPGQLAVVVLSSVEWHILKNDLTLIISAINKAGPRSTQTLNCGKFSRKHGKQF